MKKLLIVLLALGSFSAFADPYYWIDAHLSGCKRQIKRELKEMEISHTKIRVETALHTAPLTILWDIYDGDELVGKASSVKHPGSKCSVEVNL